MEFFLLVIFIAIFSPAIYGFIEASKTSSTKRKPDHFSPKKYDLSVKDDGQSFDNKLEILKNDYIDDYIENLRSATDKSEKDLSNEKLVGSKLSNNILEKYGIKYLYHMTHISNFNNILSHGLLSHNQAHSRHFTKIDISNRNVNMRRDKIENIFFRNIHDYVPFYFNPKNPMLFVRKSEQNNIIIMGFNKKLLIGDEVIFTDGNAASNQTLFYSNLDDLSLLNWNCIRAKYWNDYNDGKRIRCAEVLVYNQVSCLSLEVIFCNNIETMTKVKELMMMKNMNIKVLLNNGLYF